MLGGVDWDPVANMLVCEIIFAFNGSFLVVDTRSVETTIRMGQNMQMCHSLRCKQIDMSMADRSDNARLHFSSREFGSTCVCSRNWLWTLNAKSLSRRSSKLTGFWDYRGRKLWTYLTTIKQLRYVRCHIMNSAKFISIEKYFILPYYLKTRICKPVGITLAKGSRFYFYVFKTMRSIKRHLNQLSFMMNLYRLFNVIQ